MTSVWLASGCTASSASSREGCDDVPSSSLWRLDKSPTATPIQSRHHLEITACFRPSSSHVHAPTPRNAGFGFELSSDLLHYCGCPIDRVLALRHCKQGPPFPLFAHPGPSRSKICELVDWQSSSKRMGARLSEDSIGVGSSIRSCRRVLWLVQCECMPFDTIDSAHPTFAR